VVYIVTEMRSEREHVLTAPHQPVVRQLRTPIVAVIATTAWDVDVKKMTCKDDDSKSMIFRKRSHRW